VEKIAVISADIINSSKYEENSLVSTIQSLEEAEVNYLSIPKVTMLASRGDSFQMMMQDWENAFLKAIFLKAFFRRQTIKIKEREQQKSLDVRLSLSIGYTETIPKYIGTSLAEPFVLSGSALDQMKKNDQNIIITTGNELFDTELSLECAFLQYVLDGWTTAQAEVIYYLVQGKKQTEIAQLLGLTQPSVSNRIQLSNWSLIEKMNKRVNEIFAAI